MVTTILFILIFLDLDVLSQAKLSAGLVKKIVNNEKTRSYCYGLKPCREYLPKGMNQ
jgi:hypothetical protein